MELKFDNSSLLIHQPENLNRDNCEILISTDMMKGLKSDNLNIDVRVSGDPDEDKDGWISIELNRNNARYLKNILSAFLKEKTF